MSMPSPAASIIGRNQSLVWSFMRRPAPSVRFGNPPAAACTAVVGAYLAECEGAWGVHVIARIGVHGHSESAAVFTEIDGVARAG
jgi:hypothetical protein